MRASIFGWVTSRIHGELLKLGISVSQATVLKYVLRPPNPFSIFLAGLLALLTVIFRNHEFPVYEITAIVFVLIIYRTDEYLQFDRLGLWLLMAG